MTQNRFFTAEINGMDGLPKKPFTIGITGGIGAGKSAVTDLMKKLYSCEVISADLVAHEVQEPGGVCYEPLVRLLGGDVLDPSGVIDKRKMADLIFGDPILLAKVNGLVHPAVKEQITKRMEQAGTAKGKPDFLLVEAALLIEEHYDEILDEMWYIYASEETRRRRLQKDRQYTDQKISRIFERQLSDTVMRAHCSVVIDNDHEISEIHSGFLVKQISTKMEEYLWQIQKNIRGN